jgi:hypothetical protein
MTARPRTAQGLWLAFALLSVLPRSASAQIIDARLVPPGVLRMALSPQYQSWDQMFAPDGSAIPLGKYFSADSAGSNVFPNLANAEAAIRSITGDQSFRFNIGALNTRVDADLRRFPFEATVGLSRRLTLSVTVPIVVTRVNTGITLDTTNATAGFNQAAAVEAGSFTGQDLTIQLLAELDASAAGLQARITTGSYGCPGSSTCAQAQAVLARTRTMRSNLALLLTARPLPAVMPIDRSPAGLAMRSSLVALSADLQTFGVSGINSDFLPLPGRRLSAPNVQTILADSVFGYVTGIPGYSKHPHLGNVEVTARLGLVQNAKARFVVTGSARFPTPTNDSPDNLVDVATGDHHFGATAGFESALEAGALSLSAAGNYTRQFAGTVIRRVTPAESPIAFATTTATVTGTPGDLLWLSAYPALQLAEGFRIYGLVSYFRKAGDHFTGTTSLTGQSIDATLLEQETSMSALSIGGGISYHLLSRETALPIDAGVTYQASVSGSGGFAPKMAVVTIYLRTYYRLWGQRPPTAK